MSFDANIHVPGLWRCAKCGFVLVQSNLNVSDGSVTARDDPGDQCPNDASPLWRVTWKDHAEELAARCEEQVERACKAELLCRRALAYLPSTLGVTRDIREALPPA